jgi:hypothetical protein
LVLFIACKWIGENIASECECDDWVDGILIIDSLVNDDCAKNGSGKCSCAKSKWAQMV